MHVGAARHHSFRIVKNFRGRCTTYIKLLEGNKIVLEIKSGTNRRHCVLSRCSHTWYISIAVLENVLTPFFKIIQKLADRHTAQKEPIDRKIRLKSIMTRIYRTVFHYNDVTWASRYPKSLWTQLFGQQLVETDNIKQTKAPHCWPFARGIHPSSADSLHKGSIMQRFFLPHKGQVTSITSQYNDVCITFLKLTPTWIAHVVFYRIVDIYNK